MKIGAREIGNGRPCYVIAEAGTAYLGRWLTAISYVTAAAKAGADAVKFQVFVPDEPLFCPLEGDDRRWDRWSKCAKLPREAWRELKGICDRQGITFLASAFQPTAVQWLKELNVAAYKVASRAAMTYPYRDVPGPFIVSTGLHGRPPDLAFAREVEWLQCVSKYPTPLADASWKSSLGGGLSDHSGTLWPGLDAMARGCPMLEVHFAIDKADAGNDAPVCLSVDQLKTMCEARDAFAALRQG